jgi:hypothetical protein
MKLVMASLVAFAVACGGTPPREPSSEHCTPADQVACSCADGTQSVKQCNSNGTWGSCQCTGK